MSVKEVIKKDKSFSMFFLALFMIPYDSIHYLMPSDYAPISIYFLLIYFLFYLKKKNLKIAIDRNVIRLIHFVLYAVIFSAILSYINLNTFEFYFDFLITLILGFLSFFIFNCGFKDLMQMLNSADYIDIIMTILSKTYMVVLFIGVLEFMSLYGMLTINIKEIINTIFGGWQTARLCLTTYEASWASMHLLIAFPIFLYMKKKSNIYYIPLVIDIILFFVIVSAQGIFTLIIGLIIFLLLQQRNKADFVKFIKQIIFIVVIVAIVMFIFVQIISLFPDRYFAKRILNFESIQNFIYFDSSTFIRIGFLIIHLMIFKNHILFGVGGGNFNRIVITYIDEFFPFTKRFIEIKNYFLVNAAKSSTSLYFRIFSEFGIIGVILFYRFLFRILKNIKEIKLVQVKTILLWFSLILALPFQFASFAYVPFWMILAIISNYKNCNR